MRYPAIWRDCERRGLWAPRHLPGWHPQAAVCALSGVAANIGFASHLAAIPAAVVSTLAVAAYHDLPSRLHGWSAARAERKRLRRELAETE